MAKQTEEEVPEGAPEWMLTFCDCMTLLLTFFVLLISFATFDKDTLPELGQSFARALPSIGLLSKDKCESLYKKNQSRDQSQQPEGTETRTLAQTKSSNYMREKKPLDFRNLKVFTVPSEGFFWGRGAAISEDGRRVLDTLAAFLSQQTGRIVISENGPDGNRSLGLSRSMAVMKYLTETHHLEGGRFNLTASTTQRQSPDERQLEITLLDRSVYE
jgi:chemotaxis protein MotB